MVGEENLDKLVQLYNETLTALLDVHAPVASRTIRIRPRTDPWFDNDWRMAKRHASRLERRYKRHGSDFCRGEWISALRDYHTLANDKRHRFGNLKSEMQLTRDRLGRQSTAYCVAIIQSR